jgi:MFS family permease
VSARLASASSRPRLTLAILAVGALVNTLASSILLPALPSIKDSLNASTAGVTWLVTAFFLSGAVATGIIGRLGDIYGKRRLLIATLAVVAAGSVLGALSSSLIVVIAARALQGLGSAVFPLGIGIIRDQLPRRMVPGAIGVLQALVGVGGALGVTLGGLIVGKLGWQWLFWIPLAATLVALAGAWAFVPESGVRVPGRVNYRSGVLMVCGLGLTLMALSSGNRWGWTSPLTLGVFAIGLVVTVIWIAAERRSQMPLVDMVLMRARGVWTANAAGFLIGIGIYAGFSIFALRFTLPTSTGYGFGLSVFVAGVCLLPGALTTFATSTFTGRTVRRFGSKAALIAGSAVMAVAFAALVFADQPAAFMALLALFGVGVGLSQPALGNLTVEAVEVTQTGVATGMNAVARMIGGAVGAQLAATLIDVNTRHGIPAFTGFAESFLIASGLFLIVSVGGTFLVPASRRAKAGYRAVPALDEA